MSDAVVLALIGAISPILMAIVLNRLAALSAKTAAIEHMVNGQLTGIRGELSTALNKVESQKELAAETAISTQHAIRVAELSPPPPPEADTAAPPPAVTDVPPTDPEVGG